MSLNVDIKVPTLDVVVYKGETWELDTVLTNDNDVPIPLTGYSARAEVRDPITHKLLYTFVSGTNITITPSEGRQVLSMTATETAGLQFIHAVWDFFIKIGSVRTPLWRGRFDAVDSVTEDV